MGVVAYQCSVCKRAINLVQNKQGLDWMGNCNITLGCRGQLIQQEVFPDYVRGSLPPDVLGLKNWVQRQVLFNFEQTSPRTNWIITHNLGVLPSVQVYVNVANADGTETLQETLPEEIIYNSDDQLTLVFTKAYSGTAQLVARASSPDILNPRPRPAVVTQLPSIQLSNQSVLTLATRASTTGQKTSIAITLEYTSSIGTQTDIDYIASNVASDLSPWADTSRVMFQGKVYLVRTLNLGASGISLSNGSSVSVLNINPAGPITLNIASVNISNNSFGIAGDYSLYFVANTLFNVQGTRTINDRIWTVSSTSYDPGTGVTSVVPTDTIPADFPLPAQIVQDGQREVQPGEVIILLGSSPFTIYDKIQDSYIDTDFLATVPASVASNLFYNTGDMFASTSIKQSVYPPIRSV